MNEIDTAWFHQQLRERKQSVRGLARFMSIDPSAASRMLRGERGMSAEEQGQIADFLGVGLQEIAARRRGPQFGFGERKQEPYEVPATQPIHQAPDVKMFTEADIIYKDGKRWMEAPGGRLLELHPMFGCMKGTMTVPDDLDLTSPADPDWGKVYDDD
jgi:transcriptional regulator with XRE-family HTH domain